MKPSHRKDVIIARIIFAFMCLALIALIIGIVLLISSKHKSTVKPVETQTESETDKSMPPSLDDSESLDDNDDTQVPDSENGDTQQSSEAGGDSQTGDSQTGDSQTGDSQSGDGDETHYVEVIESVRLRTAPNTESDIITLCFPGDILKFISEDNGWTKVEYNGQTGYVSSDFLRDAQGPQ